MMIRPHRFCTSLLSASIALALYGCAGATVERAPVAQKAYREALPSNGKIVDIAVRNHHALVYAYGGEIYRESAGVVRGSGVSLLLADHLGRVVTRLDWPAENQGDVVIDSTGAAAGVLKLTTHGAETVGETSEHIALVETTIVSRLDGSADISRRLLVTGEDLDIGTVTRIFKLAVATASDGDDFWRLIHRLRNFGARQPDLAIDALRAVQERVGGILARRIGGCIDEVNAFREARTLSANAFAMQ